MGYRVSVAISALFSLAALVGGTVVVAQLLFWLPTFQQLLFLSGALFYTSQFWLRGWLRFGSAVAFALVVPATHFVQYELLLFGAEPTSWTGGEPDTWLGQLGTDLLLWPTIAAVYAIAAFVFPAQSLRSLLARGREPPTPTP